MITYDGSVKDLTTDKIVGFWDGWPSPPSPETHLRLLHSSDHVVLAIDEDNGQVIGFITAISDRVLSAYIPLLEVLPAYRGQGIGQELVRRMLAELHGYYMIDLICDPQLQPFYARAGMRPTTGMMVRDFKKQSGM